jgi:hypothetical protein
MKIKEFSIGKIIATPGALGLLSQERIVEILNRFVRGDWGACQTDDWHLNDRATWDGGRIFAAYYVDEQDPEAGKIWVITNGEDDNGERDSTCLMTPEDY